MPHTQKTSQTVFVLVQQRGGVGGEPELPRKMSTIMEAKRSRSASDTMPRKSDVPFDKHGRFLFAAPPSAPAPLPTPFSPRSVTQPLVGGIGGGGGGAGGREGGEGGENLSVRGGNDSGEPVKLSRTLLQRLLSRVAAACGANGLKRATVDMAPNAAGGGTEVRVEASEE